VLGDLSLDYIPDFFLKSISLQGPLIDTIRQFYPCLYKPNECIYKNARFHYIDIRSRFNRTFINISILKFIEERMEYYMGEKTINSFIAKTDYAEIHEGFLTIDFIISTFMNANKFVDILYIMYRE